MSSRRRLYLNLKRSIVELFKTPAHYLKEMTWKQSIFEKPYLDQDYRAMHLKPRPKQDWKTPKIDPGLGPSIWPPSRKAIFVFSDGACTFSGETGECGELITLNGWIAMVPPGSADKQIQWKVTSSDLAGAQIVNVIPSLGGNSVSVEVQLGDEFTGVVVICAKAFLIEGYFLKELAYEVPEFLNGVRVAVGWSPSLRYAMRNLPVLWERKKSEAAWDCGCVDLEVECVCQSPDVVWGAGSDETVAQNGSANLELDNHNNCEYSWSVSGTGFSLNSATGISNTLNANGSACGSAIITVTGEDDTVVTGYVRCTTGTWGNEAKCECDWCELHHATYISGKYRSYEQILCADDEKWCLGDSCPPGLHYDYWANLCPDIACWSIATIYFEWIC